MEIQKSDKEQEKLNIEKVLEEKGYLMTAPFGTSMLPFIRPQRDIIVVRKYQSVPTVMYFVVITSI